MNSISIIVLLIFAITVFSLSPGLKIAVKKATIESVKTQLAVIIGKKYENYRLPHEYCEAFEKETTLWSYHVHDCVVHMPLKPEHIKLTLKDNTNQLLASISGFNITGYAKLDGKIALIGYKCHVDIKLTSIDAQYNVSLHSDGKGRARIDVTPSTWKYSRTITTCSEIIKWLADTIADFTNKVCHAIDQVFKVQIPTSTAEIVNEILATMPISADVGDDMAIDYRVVDNPQVHDDHICTGIAGYIYNKSQPEPPPFEPGDCPDYIPDNTKGVQLFFTDYVVRSGLYTLYKNKGKDITTNIVVNVYYFTPYCDITEMPIVSFNKNITVAAKMDCDCTAVISTTGRVLEFGLEAFFTLDVKENMTEKALSFYLLNGEFSGVRYSNPFKHDLSWMPTALTIWESKINDTISDYLENHTIPLPDIDKVEFTDIEEDVQTGYLESFITPVIHIFDMEKEIVES